MTARTRLKALNQRSGREGCYEKLTHWNCINQKFRGFASFTHLFHGTSGILDEVVVERNGFMTICNLENNGVCVAIEEKADGRPSLDYVKNNSVRALTA